MTTKELINAEIEGLSEEELQRVYDLARSLTESRVSEQNRALCPD